MEDPFDTLPALVAGTFESNRRAFLAQGGLMAAGGALLAGLAPETASAAQQGNALATDGSGYTFDWIKPSAESAEDGAWPFVHIYSDKDGRTIIEKKPLTLKSVGDSLLVQAAETVAVRVIPPNMKFDWHRPSRPRLIAVLSGVARMTLRDGSQELVKPGMLLLVENMVGDGHQGEFGLDGNYSVTLDVGLPIPAGMKEA